MTLIQELVKTLNLFANSRVDLQSNPSRNSNFLSTSKKMCIQKAYLNMSDLFFVLIKNLDFDITYFDRKD